MDYDHVLILVSDDEMGRWLSQFLTPADELDTEHEGQGTSGQYFLLFNTFIELLHLDDEEEAVRNEGRFGSRYANRWSDPAACPFGFGVTTLVDPPFAGVEYAPLVGDGRGYWMSADNGEPGAPLLYATPPDRAYSRRSSIDDVEAIEDPERRATVRAYLTHPSGAQTLTRVELVVPEEVLSLSSVQALDAFDEVEVRSGAEFEMRLVLDGGRQGLVETYGGRPRVVLVR
ncbi:MAG: hypothetical protein AAF726_07560 [Planctomycetota bacterium]